MGNLCERLGDHIVPYRLSVFLRYDKRSLELTHDIVQLRKLAFVHVLKKLM